MSDNDYVFDRDDRYLQKWKVRTDVEPRHQIPLGNRVTQTRWWHSESSVNRRVVERKQNKDVEKHFIVDSIPAEKWVQKNPFPVAVGPLYFDRTSRNENKPAKILRRKRKVSIPKMIHVAKIQQHLYIGNVESLDLIDSIPQSKIDTIVNLSQKELKFGKKYVVYGFKFRNWKTISFETFCNIIDKISDIIDDKINHRGVLIVCDHGINYSVAATVGFAITRHGWTYEDVVEYIDKRKLAKYDKWNNLTLNRLKNYLRSLKSQSTATEEISMEENDPDDVIGTE